MKLPPAWTVVDDPILITAEPGSNEDEALIEATMGHRASQAAKREAYALLRAVKVWKPILRVADSQWVFAMCDAWSREHVEGDS